MLKEANARILINELLQRSGWRFFDDERGPANVTLETHVKLKQRALDDLGEDFEKTANGAPLHRWQQPRGRSHRLA